MEAVLKIMNNISGWIFWDYGGPKEGTVSYWGVLESKDPNDPASEGQIVQILKKYAPPQPS